MNAEAHFSGDCPTVNVPGSKSLTQRALVTATLAKDNSFISNALISEDTNYLVDALRELGARIVFADGGLSVSGTAGKLINSGNPLFVGYNGTALRFLSAMACLGKGRYLITGEKRLCERPVGPLAAALQSMGVDISCSGGCPPVIINAAGLAGGKIELTDIESSQYVSALLLCAPYTKKGMELKLQGNIVSAPYIDLTIAVMNAFGAAIEQSGPREYHVAAGKIYQGREYFVEGDASSASYFFLATALLHKTIRVNGISRRSRQGDIRFLDIMEQLGCKISSTDSRIEVNCHELRTGDLRFDLNDIPDMVPTLAVLAAFRAGQTLITNVAHLRLKESNRLAALATELSRCGIKAAETNDGLIINGGKMRPAVIETYNDHRIAMSFAIAGLIEPGIVISNQQCVDKSFPTFWKELGKISQV